MIFNITAFNSKDCTINDSVRKSLLTRKKMLAFIVPMVYYFYVANETVQPSYIYKGGADTWQNVLTVVKK